MGFLSTVAGPLINAGASLFGAHSAESGQRDANRTNIFLQKEAQAWEERMANTAVQRRMADLKAAGVNPLLGVGEGQGAAVPNVAPARVESAKKDSSHIMAQGVSSAAQLALQTHLAEAQIRKSNAEADNVQAQTAQVIPATVSKIVAEIELLGKTGKKVDEETFLAHIEGNIKNEDLTVLINSVPYLIAKAKAESELAAAEVPGAAARAEMYRTAIGAILPWVEKMVPVLNSAGAAGVGAAVQKGISAMKARGDKKAKSRIPAGHVRVGKHVVNESTGEIINKR